MHRKLITCEKTAPPQFRVVLRSLRNASVPGRLHVMPPRFTSSAPLFALGGLCVLAAAPLAQSAPAAPAPAEADALPLLREYCFDCHGDGSKKGGVALDRPVADAAGQRDMWFSVWRNLDAGLMPPSDKPRPTSEEQARLRLWVERSALHLDPAKPDPGRVTLRRLNREEYRNTIRDLTGVDYAVQDNFPADDTGYGFDTIGEVLNLSPLLLEKYLGAAQEIVANALSSNSFVSGQLFPQGPPPPSPEARRAYARGIIRPFANRAFRRPVDSVTLEKLTDIASAEPNFEVGILQAFSAVLAAPRFLFRSEIQSAADKTGFSVPVDEYALASRLSYFLWSTMPDEELLGLAARGELRAKLTAQVDRMLRDAKCDRFVQNFVGQWLQTRDTTSVPIQPRVILNVKKNDEAEKFFSPKVRESMRRETEALFQYVLRQNLPAEELLSAKYTFVNKALAEFYGLPPVKGPEMQKVPLPPQLHRQGLLSHGSFLVVTSNPTRTSPVKRGLFVLDNLLGTPAPPPPPNIPPLESAQHGKSMSMRELMALHRSEPLCASCHARMDPLGLALENFNALGMYREKVGNTPIDAAGQLITGEKFNNLEELIGILTTSRKHDFYRCLAEKMLTYATGRGMEASDIPNITRILERLEAAQGRLSALVLAVVESAPFQRTRGQDAVVAEN